MPRVLLFLALFGGLSPPCLIAQKPTTLTTCASIRALSETQAARRLPVLITAVVTLLPSDAPGKLTVDDGGHLGRHVPLDRRAGRRSPG